LEIRPASTDIGIGGIYIDIDIDIGIGIGIGWTSNACTVRPLTDRTIVKRSLPVGASACGPHSQQ